MIWTIIFALLMFSLIIFVHELGHFIAARLFKVTVHEFAIGMGPILFSRTKNNIKYSIRAIPMGGFCAMEGEDEESDDEGALNKKPWYKKFIILFAGAFMNIVLGFLITLILISVSGIWGGGISAPVVQSTMEEADASHFLEEGDKILKVGKTNINIVSDISFALSQETGDEISVTVKRNGKKITQNIKPYEISYEDGTKGKLIGFTTKIVPAGPLNILKESFYRTVWMGKLVVVSLKMLIFGQVGLNQMSGPIGVVSAMNQTAQAGSGIDGFLSLLFLSAFISVNIGLMNLLPIPALDGGRIFFTLIEAVRRKPIPPEKEGIVHFIGLILLIALMLFATWNDILRLIK